MFIWAATCLIASTSGSSSAASPPQSDDLRVVEQLSESDLAMFNVMLLVGYFKYVHDPFKRKKWCSRHLGVTGALRFSWLWSFSAFLFFSTSLSDVDLSSVFIAFFNLFFAWPCIGDVGMLDLGTWRLIALWIKKTYFEIVTFSWFLAFLLDIMTTLLICRKWDILHFTPT